MEFLFRKKRCHTTGLGKAVCVLLVLLCVISMGGLSAVTVKAAATGITLQAQTDNSVKISWQHVDEAVSYTIMRADMSRQSTSPSVPAKEDYVTIADGLTAQSYMDKNLELYKNYWYKVALLDNKGELRELGIESISLSFNTLKNIHAVSNGANVTITWDAVPGAKQYIVTRGYVFNGNFIKDDYEKIVNSNIFTTDSNPSRSYQYEVKAYLKDGENIYQSDNDGTVVHILTAPQNVKATVNNYNTVTLTFQTVEDADGYTIYRSASKDGTFSKIGTVDKTSSSYKDTGLTTGQDYYYQVEAFKTGSSMVSAGIMSNQVAAKPVLATPVSVKAVSKSYNSIVLTWDKVEGAKTYDVYRSASKNGEYTKIASVTKNTYTDKKLETNKKFYYKVVAVRDSQSSNESKLVNSKAVPAAAKTMTITSQDYNKLVIKWSKVSGADKYVLYRSTSVESGYKKLGTFTKTSYTDTKVKGGTPYYYKLVAYSGSAKGTQRIEAGVAVTKATDKIAVENKTATSNKITWNKIIGAQKYRVYRSTKKNSGYQAIGKTSKTSYTDKSAKVGIKYYYKVCGIINNYDGALSEPKSIVAKPSKVSNLQVTGSGSGKAKLTWTKSADADSYQIYVSSEAKSGYRLAKEVTGSSCVVSLASNSTTYYRVYAVNSGVKGKYKQISYIAISGISLNKTEADIKIGGALQLTASMLPEKATDKNVEWKTSNKKVATVTNTGLVTGKQNGTCTITATASNGMTATCRVTVSQIIIVLDPGHGGSDPGTTFNGVLEKNVNLKIALYAKAELETYKNVKVIMTRTGDTYPSLLERSQIAGDNKADFFVSIHCNMLASKTTTVNGSEVYASLNPTYAAPTSRMANMVMSELTKAGMQSRGVKTVRGETGADYYAVIRNTVARGVPAILIEEGYLSGSHDYGVLTSDAGQKRLGVANATAIATYFELKK